MNAPPRPTARPMAVAVIGTQRPSPEIRRLLRRIGRHADLLRTVAAAPRPAGMTRVSTA